MPVPGLIFPGLNHFEICDERPETELPVASDFFEPLLQKPDELLRHEKPRSYLPINGKLAITDQRFLNPQPVFIPIFQAPD